MILIDLAACDVGSRRKQMSIRVRRRTQTSTVSKRLKPWPTTLLCVGGLLSCFLGVFGCGLVELYGQSFDFGRFSVFFVAPANYGGGPDIRAASGRVSDSGELVLSCVVTL